mgnify:CR=1 FL=1
MLYSNYNAVALSYLLSLSWTHFRILLQVDDQRAREWYLEEATSQSWGYRTLQRNISTQYYYRLLASNDKTVVKNEMQENLARAMRLLPDSSIFTRKRRIVS